MHTLFGDGLMADVFDGRISVAVALEPFLDITVDVAEHVGLVCKGDDWPRVFAELANRNKGPQAAWITLSPPVT